MKVVKPNHSKTSASSQKTSTSANIFLAGSIDQGKAIDWQTQVSEALTDIDCTIYNPRRDDWDSTWKQDINNKQFNDQVTWEQEHMLGADIVFFYFDPKGQAPITLLELGQCLGTYNDGVGKPHQVIVCCPEGYWRKGNVDIVCDAAGILVHTNIEDAIIALKASINAVNSFFYKRSIANKRTRVEVGN